MSLTAGVARACITPPVGFRMGGFGARDHGAEGIHDELYARALYLNDGSSEAAIVSSDLLGMRSPQINRVRELATRLGGINRDRIFLACSHTHGGPLMYSSFEELPAEHQAYLDTICHHLAGAIAEARAAAVPVRLGTSRTAVRVGANRREHRDDGTTVLGVDLAAPTAPWVDVICFERADDGSPLAVLFQHAVHGTCLGGDNYLITADSMGVAARLVEERFPGSSALFLNGCAGNINPHPHGTFELSQRHGTRLGAAAVQALMEIEEKTDQVQLACHCHQVELPLEEARPLGECERAFADIEPEYTALQGAHHRGWNVARQYFTARAQLEAARVGAEETHLPLELQVIALNDIALIGLPGEIFVEIGEAITEASPFRLTLPVGYANGAIGYVPTREEVPFGGYEVLWARAAHQGRVIRDDADRVLVAGAAEALLHTAASMQRQPVKPS